MLVDPAIVSVYGVFEEISATTERSSLITCVSSGAVSLDALTPTLINSRQSQATGFDRSWWRNAYGGSPLPLARASGSVPTAHVAMLTHASITVIASLSDAIGPTSVRRRLIPSRRDTPLPYVGDVRYTIDTSVVIAADKREEEHDLPSIDRLIELGQVGTVALQLAEAYERDFSRFTDPSGRLQRLDWLARSPVAARRASGAIRLDVSALDGNDLLTDGDVAQLDKALIDLLGVRGNPLAKAYSDIDHLIAHYMSGADAFITVDSKTILRHRERLAELGIVVLTPAEAVARAEPR